MQDYLPPPQTRRERLWRAAESRGIPLRAILTTVGVVVAAYLVGKLLYRLRDVILIMVVAGFIALLLNPLVVALQRWKIRRRGFAVTIVTLWGMLVFIGLAVAFGYPLVNGISHLAQQLPTYVSQAEHGKGWIGHLAVKYHVQAWVAKNTPKLVSFGQGLAKPALSLGKGAATLIITLLTIFVLVLLLLLEGSKMRAGLLGMMSPAHAERYSRIAREISGSVTGYMLGNVATSVIAGVVVFVTLLVLGVPYPLLWALWVGLVDFLPLIGGALAGIPTVLFAAGHSLTAGIITLVVFLIYTQIENHVLNPVVMSRTVNVNPLLVLVSILVGASIGSWIGGTFGGFVAALLAIPTAGALQVTIREIWHATAPEPTEAAASDQAPDGRPDDNGTRHRLLPAIADSLSYPAPVDSGYSGAQVSGRDSPALDSLPASYQRGVKFSRLLIGQPARVQKGRERFVEAGQVPGVEDDTLRVNVHVPDREGNSNMSATVTSPGHVRDASDST